MKLQTRLTIGFLGLSALMSLPAIAQENQIQNFFTGTPPYNGEDITAPLNPVEATQNYESTETQQYTPATPMTTDNLSESTPISPNRREYTQDHPDEQFQRQPEAAPMINHN